MQPALQPSTPAEPRWAATARRFAFACCLLLPLALLHARALAEILIAAIDILFLACSALNRQPRQHLAWRQPFLLAALAWWLWLTICSALGTGGLLLGALAIRLPVLAVALDTWVLAGDTPRAAANRRAVWLVLAAAFCWIGLEAWQQYLFGANLFGQPRWPDGALTGPFAKPRAGPAFILLFFPALLPALATLAARRTVRARLFAAALAVLAALTMVLIGQRMPTALMLLGLATAGLLVPRLRVALAAAAAAGVALVAALPWVSPAAAAKLVQQTTGQLAHFSQSDYGLIFIRAYNIGKLHPWLGLGYDGFRRGCRDFSAMQGIGWLGIPTANFNGGYAACNIHPHNYYLEALDNAGLPGLLLFCVMVAAAMVRLGPRIPVGRLLRRGKPTATAARASDPPIAGAGAGLPGANPDRLSLLRAGVLVGAVVALWPIASTSAFTSMPNGGWIFLLLGLGFAATPPAYAARPGTTGGMVRLKDPENVWNSR